MACGMGMGAGPVNGDGSVGMSELDDGSAPVLGAAPEPAKVVLPFIVGSEKKVKPFATPSTFMPIPMPILTSPPVPSSAFCRSAIMPLNAALNGSATTWGRLGIMTDTSIPTSSGGDGYAGTAASMRAVSAMTGRGALAAEATVAP